VIALSGCAGLRRPFFLRPLILPATMGDRNFEENMRLHRHLIPVLWIALGSAAVFAQATRLSLLTS
jgi:hypothetical protein